MSASENIIRVFRIAGQDEKKKKLVPIILDALMIAVVIGTIASIVFNWNRSEKTEKMKIAIDINIAITIVTYSLKYSIKSQHMKQLLGIVDSELPKYNGVLPAAQKDLIAKTNVEKTETLHNIGILVCLMLVTLLLLPGIMGSYAIYLIQFKNENITDLPLPANVWYPKQYGIKAYLIMYFLQCAYFMNAFLLTYCAYGSIACSFQSIILNIKLFCLKLAEMDVMITRDEDKTVYNISLQDYTRYIIRCHQQIIRFVKLQTNSVELILSLCNECACFQLCVFLFMTTLVNSKIEKISYTISLVSIPMFMLIYCNCGQKVIDGSEEIRKALYECSWLDKPEWFKKDLQIMMAMANLPIHVKPYGLYILNLNTFTSVMNSAYTYFNLLRTFKN